MHLNLDKEARSDPGGVNEGARAGVGNFWATGPKFCEGGEFKGKKSGLPYNIQRQKVQTSLRQDEEIS